MHTMHTRQGYALKNWVEGVSDEAKPLEVTKKNFD